MQLGRDLPTHLDQSTLAVFPTFTPRARRSCPRHGMSIAEDMTPGMEIPPLTTAGAAGLPQPRRCPPRMQGRACSHRLRRRLKGARALLCYGADLKGAQTG